MRSNNSQRRWKGPFPDWIPPCVRELAEIMYNDVNRRGVRVKDKKFLRPLTSDPRLKRVYNELLKKNDVNRQEVWANIDLLHRLTFDARMKRVWDELLKKKRLRTKKTERFVYPVQKYCAKQRWSFQARLLQSRTDSLRRKGEDAAARRNQIRVLLFEMEVPNTFSRLLPRKLAPQEQGLVWLFQTAFSLGRHTPRSVSMAEKRKAVRRFRTMAKTVRTDAAEQQRLRGFVGDRLLEAGFAYDELADDPVDSLGATLLVSRKPRKDARLKGFVKALASTTKEIFGAPLFGTVATFANVALDRDDVTGEKVRKMFS